MSAATKALVTGGAGFIGSHLCDALLARGMEVHCLDNLHLGRMANIAHLESNQHFHFHRMDLLDGPAVGALFGSVGFDVVFHMAANSDIQAGSRDHRVDLDLTFNTTYQVLEQMLHHGVKNLFFASTSAIFGETGQRIHEDIGPLRPISYYGAAKLASESYISVYVNNYGFRAWVLRFPNVVGERATHGAIYDFIHRLRQDPGKLVVLGDGSQIKPYMHVSDLVAAILLVHDKAPEQLAVYNVGNEDRTSVARMAEIVMEQMGLDKARIQYTGGDRGWVGDVPKFEYDTSKIRALGWQPQYASTEAVELAVRRILGLE